ncbi:MAG TPA: hypothetical protein VIJ19_04095 [Opitutaceae bacterium]
MEFEKPETKHLVLKPKVIVPTDTTVPQGDASRISVQKIHAQNVQAEKKKFIGGRGPAPAPLALPDKPSIPPGFKHREIEVLNEMADPDDIDAVNIPEILLENRIAEEQSGWGQIRRWGKRRSRRTRDFLIVVGTTDILIGLLMKTVESPMMVVYGLSAITLVTVCVGWIMFFVMDPY